MGVLRAREGFSYDNGGVPVVLRAGRLVDEDDPAVKGREHLFEPAEDVVSRTSGVAAAVETTTAIPGERRTIQRGARPRISTPEA